MANEELDAAIRALYPSGGTKAVQEQFPEVDVRHIRYRAGRLGVRYKAPSSISPDLDDAIRRLYPSGGALAVQHEFPDRGLPAIRQRANRLGIQQESRLRPSTPAEDDLIRRRYPTEGAGPLARELGRSPDYVWAKAAYLGVRSAVRPGNKHLDEAQVAVIKQKLQQGHRNNDLAAEYGVSLVTISRIRNGKSWPHVAPAENPGGATHGQ